MADPKFTPGETAKIAWLVARMAKRGIADDKEVGRIDQSDLQKKLDRVIDGAREREAAAKK